MSGGDRRLRACRAVLLLSTLSACAADESSIVWRIVFAEQALADRAVGVTARISRDECPAAEGEGLYAASFSGERGPRPPRLRPGTYAFSASAWDAGCAHFAAGCETVALPMGDGATLVVVLEQTGATSTCAGECVDGLCRDLDGGVDGDALVDGDVDEPCVPGPAGIDAAELDAAGCPTLDDAGLLPLAVVDEAEVDTGACASPTLDALETCVATLGAREVCVVVASSLSIEEGAELRAAGPRPLLVVAAGPVDVAGAIVVDGAGFRGGPGGGSGGREPAAGGEGPGGGGPGEMGSPKDGGGGGGGHAAGGGRGGCDTGGAGGVATVSCEVVDLVGGSGGGNGGDEEGGDGGGGGGALHLYSGTVLTVGASGVVAARGGRGSNAADGTSDGGGGGGSGGTVVLDAPRVVVDGVVSAAGGDGGEGRSEIDGDVRGPGGSGADGERLAGGDGSCGAGDLGGGGGGGAAGLVFVLTVSGRAEGDGSIEPDIEECTGHVLPCAP